MSKSIQTIPSSASPADVDKASSFEARIRELVTEHGPIATFRRLIAENDALLLSPDLEHAREVLAARTAIYTFFIADWARTAHQANGYGRRFAVVALGGTGREEMTPRSDVDVALLFDDALDGNMFLDALHQQAIHGTDFLDTYGFRFLPLPYSFDGVHELSGKDRTSFMDMRAIYDPSGLAPAFRRQLRAVCDPFEHFVYVCGFWKKLLAGVPACERMDRFDIKSDALRVFQAGVWTLAANRFDHSHEIYRADVDEQDLAAYFFLLRIRSWVHLRRPSANHAGNMSNHPEDILTFDDFVTLGEMLGPDASEEDRFAFGNEVRARLLSARRRVVAFARGVIEHELRDGCPIRPGAAIALGPSGLRHAASQSMRTAHAKSRAAGALLLAAQRYNLPIDPYELQAAFLNAGDWLERVPEIGALFYETRGSLATTFEFIRQIDGMEERIFPGRSRFEASLDARVLSEQRELRGAMELRKLRELERFVAEGQPKSPHEKAEKPVAGVVEPSPVAAAKYLDPDHLAAVKLALKTKRLPVTAADTISRGEASRPLHERYASGFSGTPLADYYRFIGPECGFSPETISVTEFLVENRRIFRTYAEAGWNEKGNIENLGALCGSEQRLHALFVFTCADSNNWRDTANYPARWFLIRELYVKTVNAFRAITPDPMGILAGAGFTSDDLPVLQDFGADFFGGLYRRHIIPFGEEIVRLAIERDSDLPPKVAIIRDGAGLILGIAARDFQGLAACISGALWHQGVVLTQAHFFSAMNHRLVLDFFHISADEKPLPADLTAIIQRAVRDQLHIAESDEAAQPRLAADIDFQEPTPRKFRLRCTMRREAGGLIYALCLKLHRHLVANIHSLTANITRDGTAITIQLTIPERYTLAEAQRIVSETF